MVNISATQQTLIRHLGALGTCEGLWEKPIVSPGLKASRADSVGKAGVWETTRSQGALGFRGS